ncbi:hypothetical protein ACLOJK_024840 [Asimina triloba]
MARKCYVGVSALAFPTSVSFSFPISDTAPHAHVSILRFSASLAISSAIELSGFFSRNAVPNAILRSVLSRFAESLSLQCFWLIVVLHFQILREMHPRSLRGEFIFLGLPLVDLEVLLEISLTVEASDRHGRVIVLLCLFSLGCYEGPYLINFNGCRESAFELVQRYRRDRRVLLNFILSGSLIKKVVMPPGAVSLDDVDLDQVSIDYVLNCAKKGDALELSESIREYHDRLELPPWNHKGFVDEFFLVTSPETSGSAPARAPPPVPVFQSPIVPLPSLSKSESIQSTQFQEESVDDKSTQSQELTVDDIDDFTDEDDNGEVESLKVSRRPNAASDLLLRLPSFATGITEDDLRETAYEILLVSAGAAGALLVPAKEKKKDRKSRFMKKLGRSKDDHGGLQSERATGLAGLLDFMRVQLEISEASDVRTRQGLLHALIGKEGKRMDTLLVPLELLSCVSRTEFSDKKAYLRWQKRQLNMLEEGLLNHPAVGFAESGLKANDLRVLLRTIEESELLPSSAGEIQRTECLRSLREITISLAERPARNDLTGEVCHWADGYHLNVRLYEKLLLSLFDMVDEGKLGAEAEEILELLKSTWRILGITETIHDTCYAFVLFRQVKFLHMVFVLEILFVSGTGEQRMLQYAVNQMKKIPLKEQRGPQERLHLKSLCCSVEGSRDCTFMQSFLLPIQKWADKQLGDYHLHFVEGSAMMEGIVTVAMVSGRLLLEESGQGTVSRFIQAIQSIAARDREQIEAYISSSIKSAFSRILHAVEATEETASEHFLALLAEESKKLLKKDTSIFAPILSKWNSLAAAISASLLHKLYGIKLKPFLDGVEHLTEDAVSVFPAADGLEQYIMGVIESSLEDETVDEYYKKKLVPYQIETVSGTLVLRWVNSQSERILGWIKRTTEQEEAITLRWVPISPQQRHGSSVVEVFRIIEEADWELAYYLVRSYHKFINCIDNFGRLKSTDQSPDFYFQQYDRKQTADQFFTLKVPMRPLELTALISGLDNAFQVYTNYVVEELVDKEELIPPPPILTRYKKEHGIKAFAKKEKDAFDGSRKEINAAIDRICEFTGTKIIFWDLREPFIDNLYKNGVSQSRFEVLLEAMDILRDAGFAALQVLNELCDVIVESLRDRIVTGLLQASLDGLLRVLLDGGPSRVFFPSDAKLLEEDLEILKEFFISGGDGLPRGTVENFVARVRFVITLHSYETRVLIDELKSASLSGLEGGRGKMGADSDRLIRILCHRNDSEANQFLKKQYKLPRSSA